MTIDAYADPVCRDDLRAHYNRLTSRFSRRDHTHQLVHEVRQGNTRDLFPAELNFSLTYEGTPIANFVDIVAHDMAEGIAPLPSLACVSGRMKSLADLERAEIKNRIGDDYWSHSKLEIQNLSGADRYVTYASLPMMVEPDLVAKKPVIRYINPRHSYYELDRYGETVVFAHRHMKRVDDLCAQFPEWDDYIRRTNPNDKRTAVSGDTELEMVEWVDRKCVTLFLPQRGGLTLAGYDHKLSRHPVVVAERPGDGDMPRGQFDDAIWTQIARAIMSTLALEAASLAVQAPIAVPTDMDEFPVGPHAVLQSDKANEIHRVNLELPPATFAENQNLDNELRVGTRYPDARSGGVQASVITGKGVEALLGTFDTQIKGAQMVFKDALQRVTSRCFEMDEVWWPDVRKTVTGTMSGSSYEFDYTPKQAINGRWNCTVTYGFAAGMHPSQSIITMLQLEGAGMIAKGTTMENLPFGVDQIQEKRKIDVEGTQEALKQGIFSVIQSAGPMAAQGQDPLPYLQLAVDTIKMVQDGKPIEEAVVGAFRAMQQAQQAAAQAAQAQQPPQAGPPGAPPDGGGAPGGDGLPPGVAPGQAGLPPGGMPAIENLIAGMRGGGTTPVLQATVQRRVPIG